MKSVPYEQVAGRDARRMNLKSRRRRPLPPAEQRDWLLAHELYPLTGMSEATVNRHARGELQPMLPSIPVGRRRRVFFKPTVVVWRTALEQGASNK
jgi:hypothetical protein